jgi:drug/metabolite transporter (DMT)-like permease
MPIFGKLAYGDGVTPEALLLLRFSLAAVLLGAALAVRPSLRSSLPRALPADVGPADGSGVSGAAPGTTRGRATNRRSAGATTSRRRLVLTALALGAVGYATQSSFYFAALDRIDAPMVALVLYTYPALVTVGAVVLGRERLTARRATALGVSSCGTLLVLLGAGGVSFDLIGVALAFSAAVTYTVYILVADTVVHRMPPVVLSALVMTGAAVSLLGRELLTGGVQLDFGAAGWFWVSCLAVVSTVVAMLAFFAGLRRSGPAAAAILSTFEPVVTTALAAVVLSEFLTPVQLAGGLVVLASVVVLQLRARSPRTSAPAIVRGATASPDDLAAGGDQAVEVSPTRA